RRRIHLKAPPRYPDTRIGVPCRKKYQRALAQPLDDIRPLHELCRYRRLYDVERWIADGKPLQLTPEAITKGTRSKTALQIALQTGQRSLAFLLLKSGYRLELERYAPLDLALQSRRWDLFDLLIQRGGDLMSVDAHTLLKHIQHRTL